MDWSERKGGRGEESEEKVFEAIIQFQAGGHRRKAPVW